jgi:hypothetical protein
MSGGAEKGRQAVRAVSKPAEPHPYSRNPSKQIAGSLVVWGIGGSMLVAAFCITLAALAPTTDARPGRPLLFDAFGADPAGCTALTLDRHHGSTSAEPCRGSTAMHEVLASGPAKYPGAQ